MTHSWECSGQAGWGIEQYGKKKHGERERERKKVDGEGGGQEKVSHMGYQKLVKSLKKFR